MDVIDILLDELGIVTSNLFDVVLLTIASNNPQPLLFRVHELQERVAHLCDGLREASRRYGRESLIWQINKIDDEARTILLRARQYYGAS